MKKFPVALQLFSVREDTAADFEGTVRKVASYGYDGVEFAGVFGRTAEQVKTLCAEVGITPISAHVSFEELMQDPEGVVSLYAEIGCKYIVIPYLNDEYRPGRGKFGETAAGFRMLGALCSAHGIRLCYHNHEFEFEKVNGEYALDILYKEIPETVLASQLDTCWVNVGGESPAAYLKKYAGRAPTIHLRDFVMPGRSPVREYAPIARRNGVPIWLDGSEGLSDMPVGYGSEDIEALLHAAEEAGTEWLVIELDEPTEGLTALGCAGLSMEYLKTLIG